MTGDVCQTVIHGRCRAVMPGHLFNSTEPNLGDGLLTAF